MLSPHEKRDKTIRATDLDALSCRYSANHKKYFQPEDQYIPKLIAAYQGNLQFCSGYTNLSSGRTIRSVFSQQKLPIINRGTYFRTRVIDQMVKAFVGAWPSTQVISLGGGSDTRCFRLFEEHPEADVRYIEIDFEESAKIKKLAIVNDAALREIVGYVDPQTTVASRGDFSALHPDIHTDKYHLIGGDLRSLKDGDTKISPWIDVLRPTIILSECVLCYLTIEDNEGILRYLKSLFSGETTALFLIYEPMSLNDAFGDTMIQNLSTRGIDLRTFSELATLEQRAKFLKEVIGLDTVRVTDISEVAGYGESLRRWLDDGELARINRLEMIDEVEEIRLLFRHYCLCYGAVGNFSAVDNWPWTIVA